MINPPPGQAAAVEAEKAILVDLVEMFEVDFQRMFDSLDEWEDPTGTIEICLAQTHETVVRLTCELRALAEGGSERVGQSAVLASIAALLRKQEQRRLAQTTNEETYTALVHLELQELHRWARDHLEAFRPVP